MMSNAFDELKFGENDKIIYLNNFTNYLIYKSNIQCVSAWKTTVGYNYYRGDFDNLGKNWKKTGKDYSDSWRPNSEIRDTFADELVKMIGLLEYCIQKFNATTPTKNKIDIYENLIFFRKQLLNSYSFKRMVETTRNGYGAVISENEYWTVNTCLTNTQIQEQKIARYNIELISLKNQKITEDIKEKAEKAAKEKEIADKRFKEYWEKHSDRKSDIDKEISDIDARITVLNKDLETADSVNETSAISEKIKNLTSEKDNLGIFKAKEKKIIQEQIDRLNSELSDVEKKIKEKKIPLEEEIKNLTSRKETLEKELKDKPELDKPDEDELAGLIIEFGHYYINDANNLEPLKWKILEKNGNKALVITKSALNGSVYDHNCTLFGERCAIWEASDLRNWLNNDFYNVAFNDDEKSKIQFTDVVAHVNPGFSVDCGSDTEDKIFALSIIEAEKYFKDDEDRICKATAFAKANNIKGSKTPKYAENCQWWLRTSGGENGFAVAVGFDGAIGRNGGKLYSGHGAWDNSVGVRPAMWVEIDQ